MTHISKYPEIIKVVQEMTDQDILSLQDMHKITGIPLNKVSMASIFIKAGDDQWWDSQHLTENEKAAIIIKMRDEWPRYSWERIAVYGYLQSPMYARKLYEKYTGRSAEGRHWDGRGRPKGSATPRWHGPHYAYRPHHNRFLIDHGISEEKVLSMDEDEMRAYCMEIRKDLRRVHYANYKERQLQANLTSEGQTDNVGP